MTKPFYTSAAQQDLADILHYIGRDKPEAALAWVDKIEAKCLLIANNPAIGELQPRLGEGVRSSIVGRYVIFHRQANQRVEILRVIAADRDITQLSRRPTDRL
jgi:toxin ParE1/3/4